jgi:hypothetical protein
MRLPYGRPSRPKLRLKKSTLPRLVRRRQKRAGSRDRKESYRDQIDHALPRVVDRR